MAEPFIGQIIWWAPNFAPRGWALCHGQLLQITQHEALFSLLGTTYGGDGRTTFGLPDLRGRVPIHKGYGPGLSNYTWGQKLGAETVRLSETQIPAHNHPVIESPQVDVVATTDEGDQQVSSPTNRLAAGKLPTGHDVDLYSSEAADTALGGLSVSGSPDTASAGGSAPHDNMQPFQCLNYIIALVGYYPSRS